MKKSTALLAVLWLSGCTLTPNSQIESAEPQVQLNAPKVVKHNGKNYQLKAQKDLGTMVRYVYFNKKETGKNWKSAVELLHDRNVQRLSLEERIKLREKVYKNNGVEHFNLTQTDGDLYAFVIYAPNTQENNWQLEVARATDVPSCGFVQYQYSVKVPQSRKLANMGKVKLIGYLKKYAIDKEMAQLKNLKWDWQCALPKTTLNPAPKG
ncbi:6-phosphofructokinase [Pasteurellaceae bacterium Pebbles2]|nr:6-phosphofructokinase [Pasteurellaceae bacterium Pebbles2]